MADMKKVDLILGITVEVPEDTKAAEVVVMELKDTIERLKVVDELSDISKKLAEREKLGDMCEERDTLL